VKQGQMTLQHFTPFWRIPLCQSQNMIVWGVSLRIYGFVPFQWRQKNIFVLFYLRFTFGKFTAACPWACWYGVLSRNTCKYNRKNV